MREVYAASADLPVTLDFDASAHDPHSFGAAVRPGAGFGARNERGTPEPSSGPNPPDADPEPSSGPNPPAAAPAEAERRAGEPAWMARLREPGRRLFVAVPLPPEAATAVAALVEGVRGTDGAALVLPVGNGGRGNRDVRWVRLDNLHVTLRFIGPTLDPKLPDVAEAVQHVAAAGHPFEIGLVGAGAFPHPENPRALWLGIGAGGTELAELAAGLDAALSDRGWPPAERPFRPHLTLARSDGIRAGPRLARRLIEAAATLSVRWKAGSIVLFESRTGGGPARYVPLLEAPLGRPTKVGAGGGLDDTIPRDAREPPPQVVVQGDLGSS